MSLKRKRVLNGGGSRDWSRDWPKSGINHVRLEWHESGSVFAVTCLQLHVPGVMVDSTLSSMKWVSALSTRPSLEAAVDEVIAATQEALGAPAHLGFVFISSTFASEYPRLLPLLRERLQLPALIGCGGGGIVGNGCRKDTAQSPSSSSDSYDELRGKVRQSSTAQGSASQYSAFERSASNWFGRNASERDEPERSNPFEAVNPFRFVEESLPPQPVIEVEDEPALVLCLAHLPGVSVDVFWLDEEELPDLDAPPKAWIDYVGVDPRKNPDFVLIADPLTSNISDLLQGMDFAYPASVKVGGLASGGTSNRANGLFCNDQYYEEGTIGVALSGNIALQSVVAQGCRPVGPIFRVLEGERNVILKIEAESGDLPADIAANATPLEALQGLLRKLTEDERELAQRSLFVGVAYSEFQDKLEQGNFLIRSLVGIDPRLGAVAIGERVRPGQRIQFHLRDAAAASEDLALMLERHNCDRKRRPGGKSLRLAKEPFGALMFSCMGRGEELYDAPNVDSNILQSYLPPLSVGGFFCNGEIGPIGGNTYVHGYTAVFGLFYERLGD